MTEAEQLEYDIESLRMKMEGLKIEYNDMKFKLYINLAIFIVYVIFIAALIGGLGILKLIFIPIYLIIGAIYFLIFLLKPIIWLLKNSDIEWFYKRAVEKNKYSIAVELDNIKKLREMLMSKREEAYKNSFIGGTHEED